MSSWTLLVAVAVKAIIGILSFIRFKIDFKFLYSGLKSCPHSEIQCASSTAKNEIFTLLKNWIYSSFASDSGATYKSLVIPLETSLFTFSTWELFSDEFNTWATLSFEDIPLITSTWFFINAINGDTTSAVPLDNKAGNWKQRDLPAPVGMITIKLFLSRSEVIINFWSPLKSENPNKDFNSLFKSILSDIKIHKEVFCTFVT